ncbi:MAG TPA: LLM class flavin-dependent oxidoreductase, partial [Actinomycetes bacterium]
MTLRRADLKEANVAFIAAGTTQCQLPEQACNPPGRAGVQRGVGSSPDGWRQGDLAARRANEERRGHEMDIDNRRYRFGVLGESAASGKQLLEEARRAEDLGYATFLLRDHFVADAFGPQLAPLPALTAVAAATSRLRIGTLVLDNDYRHPVILAKEAATLDHLSDGRLELGIGAGWLR